MLELVDTHTHLDFPDFQDDLPAVLERSRAAGVGRWVAIGCDPESSAAAIRLAEVHPGMVATVGWHPGHVTTDTGDAAEALARLAAHPRVAAIGECGLDYHRLPGRAAGDPGADAPLVERQKAVFRSQLELAAQRGLGCVIHTRDSLADTLEIFRPWAGRVRAVFHCFGGTRAELEAVLETGALVSFTGIVTFRNAAQVREAAAAVPSDRYMLETDCPYLAPVPHRGRRCEPGFVREIAGAVAAARGIPVEQAAAETTSNASAFFRGLTGTPCG